MILKLFKLAVRVEQDQDRIRLHPIADILFPTRPPDPRLT